MKNRVVQIILCALVFCLVGGAAFTGALVVYNHSNLENSQASVLTDGEDGNLVETVSTQNAGTQSVADIAQNVLPSVVAIDVLVTETQSDLFGRTYDQEYQASGSGIIIGQDKKNIYVATNNHVVEDATQVSVTFADDSQADASVKGTDASADIAVVIVETETLSSDTLESIKIATLGDSDEVAIGDRVIAIGNALGYGTSVTVGYISAKDREISVEDLTLKLLQTDAAINEGNSGGALVNSAGAVIGINCAKIESSSVEGMGYAIPISTAVPIINDIINAEQIDEKDQGYLGITGTDIDSEYAAYYNMPEGVYVSSVTENSPAEKAGMLVGDIITEFDGSAVSNMENLQNKLSHKKAGSTVDIVVMRSNDGEFEEKTLSVTLGAKSAAKRFDTGSDDAQDGENTENNEEEYDSDYDGQNGDWYYYFNR